MQARAEEEAARRAHVDASLEKIKEERVQEAEQSASTMAGLLEDLDKAREELVRLEPMEVEEQRELNQLKKSSQEQLNAQTRRADLGANEVQAGFGIGCSGFRVGVWGIGDRG